MVRFLGKVLAYVFKNLGVVIGVVEAVLKAVGAIVSLTPTKKDDAVYATIDKIFSSIKKWLYTISDKLAGKPANIPN
jgi:hypothetical protein